MILINFSLIFSVLLFFQACDSDWTEFNGHCYRISQNASPWSASFLDCKLNQANLVSITSREENRFIMSMVHKTQPCWIGLIETGTIAEWGNGEHFAYNVINRSASRQGENYVIVNGLWETANASAAYPYICEKP